MSENVLIAIIAACSALSGGVIGGLISMWTAKKSADREDRRRREEIERKTADERIKKLYEPLLAIITPGPPYDEYYLDSQTQKWIIEKIEQNERFASPDLLNVFWKIRRAYYEQQGDIDREIEWKILDLVSSEYDKLKAIIGYGRILKKESKIKIIYGKIKSLLDDKLKEFRRKMHIRRIKKRQKKSKEE